MPTALKKPIAIIASKTQNNTSLVAILSVSHNGHQIIAPFYIDGFGTYNGVNIDSNAITSVYAKSNSITKLLKDAIDEEVNGKIGVFYWDKKEPSLFFHKKRSQCLIP